MHRINNSFIMRLHSNIFCILFSAVDERQGTDVGNDEPNKARDFFASVQYPRNIFFIRHFSISVGHAFQLPQCWSTFCYYFLTCNFECALSFFHTIAHSLLLAAAFLYVCIIIVMLLFEADIIQWLEKSSKLFSWQSYWNWNENRRHIKFFFHPPLSIRSDHAQSAYLNNVK